MVQHVPIIQMNFLTCQNKDPQSPLKMVHGITHEECSDSLREIIGY